MKFIIIKYGLILASKKPVRRECGITAGEITVVDEVMGRKPIELPSESGHDSPIQFDHNADTHLEIFRFRFIEKNHGRSRT